MLEETNFCPFCGTNLELDSRYCHNCGAYLKENVTDNTPSVKIIAERPLSSLNKQLPKTHPKQYSINTKDNAPKTNTSYHTDNINESVHPVKKQNNGQGVVSILFAFLALIGFMPLIGSTLAIITGGWKAGPLGILGRSLGWVSFIFYVGFALMMFL